MTCMCLVHPHEHCWISSTPEGEEVKPVEEAPVEVAAPEPLPEEPLKEEEKVGLATESTDMCNCQPTLSQSR